MEYLPENIVVLFIVLLDNIVMGLVDEGWWGPKMTWNDTSIRPFRVEFQDDMIEDLRYRLMNHRPFTPPLEGVGFEYGFNTDYLYSWIDYWAHDYNFSEREDFLNQFPQYTTNIQGLDIHFLWVKPQHVPPHVQVIPLLLMHGFPGSVVEFYKTIPLLTAVSKNKNFAVEVIVPSLPGFGFSEGAVRPGLGAAEMGVVMRNLMHRLGFKKYYVQGGDFGAIVGLNMATIYPEETLGYHTNMAVALNMKSLALWFLGSVYPPLIANEAVIDRLYPILDYLQWALSESGYLHMQATKPDTIGTAMSDSPSGLLAYVLQLFSSGSRKKYVSRADGGLDELYTRDELLDSLMMYWVPNSFITSARLYAESINERIFEKGILKTPTPVPTWTIHAKDEIIYMTPAMLRFKFPNLLHSTVLDGKGHFLALEAPEIFADDVLQALDAFRIWHESNESN